MRLFYSGTILLFLFLSLSPVTAQVIILEEEFNSNSAPSGWTNTNVSFTTSATGYARFEQTNSILTTPTLDLSGYINVTLEFEVAKYGSGTDGPLTVQISEDGGSTWTAQTFNSPTPTSSTYTTSGPTAITATGSNVKIRFIRTGSPSEKRLGYFLLEGEEGSSLCSSPTQATFTTFPTAIAQSSPIAIEVGILCADDNTSDCNNGSVTLTTDACGLSGTLTQPVVDGIAVFDDLEISRSLQPGIHFTAAYSGTCGSYTIQSPSVDVEAPAATSGGLKIAFLKVNSDDPDEFAFVALSEIPSGQQIFFTDNGWFASGGFRDNEGTLRWTAPSIVSCGTIIIITGTNSANIGTVTQPNTGFALATEGDQILAFTGSETSPTFIAGISIDGSCWGDATSSNTSALPAPLIEGVNAVCLGETDNSILTFSPNGDPDEVMTQINTASNWTNNGTRINTPYSGTITVNCATGDPTPLPTADAGPDFIGCNGGPNALAVTVTDAIGSVSYSWSPGGTIDGGTNSQTAEATNTSTTTYTVTITDDDGCESTADVTVNIPSGTAGQWTNDYGNSDWFECRNWANGLVPDQFTPVSIPAGTSDPEIADEPFHAFCQDLNIESGRTLLIDGDPELSLKIHGNITGYGAIEVGVGDLIFAGSADQTIAPNVVISTYNLVLNNPGNTILSNTIIDVSNLVSFNNGFLEFTPGNQLVLSDAAQVTGASNTSFVDGAVKKTSNGANFTFPVGDSNADGTFYQPVRMFDFTGNTVITAQYFAEEEPNAGAYYDGESNSPDDNQEIGNCDFWNVIKQSGSNVRLGFSYVNSDPNYCNTILDQNYLNLARWNGLTWDYPIDEGVDPINVPDEVSSIGPIQNYGHFVLASNRGDLVVLPISLLHFNATVRNSAVLTEWITASETNNDYFTVERSSDAIHFSPIGTVEGAGNSHSHQAYMLSDDHPLYGISYYRLKQTDFDGRFSYSEIRSVLIEPSGEFRLNNVYRSGDALQLEFSTEASNLHVELFDVLGKSHFRANVETGAGRITLYPNLVRGAYIARISIGSQSDTKKFVW